MTSFVIIASVTLFPLLLFGFFLFFLFLLLLFRRLYLDFWFRIDCDCISQMEKKSYYELYTIRCTDQM